jgi:hypothetical protein
METFKIISLSWKIVFLAVPMIVKKNATEREADVCLV